MNYYEKYIKYKNKYINLKDDVYMTGGDKPMVEILKDINLFKIDSELEKYLNPTYGFLLCETGFITNHYNFYNKETKSHNMIGTFIHELFHKIPNTNEIKPTNRIFKINAKDIGLLLGFLYIKYIKYIKDIPQIISNIKTIKRLVDNISKFTKKYDYSLSMKKATEICDVKNTTDKIITKLYRENFKSLRIDGIELNIPEFKLRYVDKLLSDSLTNYVDRLSKIINEPKYSNKYIREKIFNNIVKEEINKDIFHVILAILWWISDDKEKIKQYYLGLNDMLFPEMQVVIPVDFNNCLFEYKDVTSNTPSNFEQGLAIAYTQTVSSIKIIDYENATSKCGSIFPDCGETSLRNFINIITYDPSTQKFDTGPLILLGAHEKLINYYMVFDTISKQVSTKTKFIFGAEFTGRNAWAELTSNLDGVSYVKTCNSNGSVYNYEINSGLDKTQTTNNVLVVLCHLFTKVRRGEDFNVLVSDLDIDIDSRGLGNIHFKNKIGNFDWKFSSGHYQFNQEKLAFPINIEHLTKDQRFYIGIIMNNLTEEMYEIPTKKYYYVKYTLETLINFINSEQIEQMENIDYGNMFNYLYNYCIRDQLGRIKINFNKIENLSEYIYPLLNVYIKYDDTGEKNYINVISLKVNTSNSLDKFLNLRSLEFVNNFDQDLGTSLISLVKLQNITFGDQFNQNLGTSLASLVELQNITFGYNFNQNLDTSLAPLVELQNITFGYNFNQNLGTSLTPLIKLRTITFGDQFNKNLGTSLSSLINLQNITFGYNFNQDLGTSLTLLINLQNITFECNYNQVLGTSLTSLINLQNITFGQDFNQDLGTSLISLVKLQSITFGNNFNKNLASSLDSLISLKNIQFGNSFNQELNAELNSLTSLQSLTFGSEFNKSLETSLNNLTNLRTLIFGSKFNQKLKTSLDSLINLQILTFGREFNENLETSLDKLTNLDTLIFGDYFNQKLEASLNKLTGLKKLTFGTDFNQGLGTSLDSLTNLQNLTFGHQFNQPLDLSLYLLKSLQNLTFGYKFNQLLSGPLDYLDSLQVLTLGNNFDHDLDFVMGSLESLHTLKFEPNYRGSIEYLPHSLVHAYNFNENYKTYEQLTNLQTLTFANSFNEKLGSLLVPLTKLVNLTFGSKFNQEVENLPSGLKHLTFGYDFNTKLGHSLDRLAELESLTFGDKFNQELDSALSSLVKLQSLIFGKKFNQTLDSEFNSLVELKQLRLGNEFDQNLGSALDSLVNLQILSLGSNYEQNIARSIKKLKNIESIKFVFQ